MPKRTTIKQLALMIAKGFEEIRETMATKHDFKKLEQKFETEINRLDIRLDQMAPEFEIKDLRKRVNRLENHLGLT